ncbi:MAG: dihydrodipicolinate synthase family protein [Thermotogae bacterium]|nr:dihydrodipicolinate synthase family protein [Thermotogota bacterium]
MKLITAILTKFDEDGKLVLDGEYIRFLNGLIEDGVDAFFIGGTNGEFHTMNLEERKKQLEFIHTEFKGKVEMIAHVGGNNFLETLKLGEFALSLGVRKLAVVAPYYFKYDEKAIVDYFTAVANCLSDAEIILYNIPSFTGNRIEPMTILKVKDKSHNIIGLKDSDSRPWIVGELKEKLGGEFQIYSGNDDMAVDYLLRGTDGQVSGTSNVFPKILRKLLDDFEDGKYESTFRLQRILHKIVVNVSNHIAFVGANKYVLKLLGYDLGFPRLPSRSPTDEEKKSLREFLEKVREWAV